MPLEYLPNFKNPCFWQDYEKQLSLDPYADSPYAPEIGVSIKYDPWGHTNYYRKARGRFATHVRNIEKNGEKVYQRIRCLPYFYLISTPKSGTTTLWNQLVKGRFKFNIQFKTKLKFINFRHKFRKKERHFLCVKGLK